VSIWLNVISAVHVLYKSPLLTGWQACELSTYMTLTTRLTWSDLPGECIRLKHW